MLAEKCIAQLREPIEGIPVESTELERPTFVEKALSLTPSTVMVVFAGFAIRLLLAKQMVFCLLMASVDL